MRLEDHRRAVREAGGRTKPLAAVDGGEALAERINQEHKACEEAGRTALEHAIRCGELLNEAWEAVEFGHWMAWVKENFEGSKSTEENYRKLANNKQYLIEPDSQRVANLSIREALALLVPERDDSDDRPSSGHSAREAGSAGKEATRKPGRSEPGGARSALAGPGAAKTVLYRLDDLPASPDDLETALSDGRAVTISCDAPVTPAAGKRALREARAFLEAAVRAAGMQRCDAHLLVFCSSDPEIREAAERALSFVAPPSAVPDDPFLDDYDTGEEISPDDRERERYQRDALRKAEKKAGISLYRAVRDAGGIRSHQDGDLREECQQIPLRYRRGDGLTGDEMADYLDTHHPEFNIHTERDLIDALARRRRAA